MPRSVTIQSLPVAFAMMKTMQDEGLGWGEDCRPLARRAMAEIIEDSLAARVDAYLLNAAARGVADRRNGSYPRRILTELGDIELSVPRTRTWSPVAVVRAYARRTSEVDRMILACFVLGLSTRKVGEALLPILGRPVSASAVSQVAKSLDTVVAAFIAAVVFFAQVSPFTRTSTFIFSGLPSSSGVTIHGPMALPMSKLLPLVGPSRPCISITCWSRWLWAWFW